MKRARELSVPTDDRIDALRAGDPRAIADALEELMPSIRRWLFRLLGPGADLDDATQDALIQLAGALRRFEGRASLRTLAYRVTVRVSYRFMSEARRRRDDAALELVPPPADEIDPESRAMHREALKRLYRCLAQLPPKRRVAFVLCAIEGLTASEAAQIEGTNAITMRSRFFYAKREVNRRLAHDPYVARLLDTEAP